MNNLEDKILNKNLEIKHLEEKISELKVNDHKLKLYLELEQKKNSEFKINKIDNGIHKEQNNKENHLNTFLKKINELDFNSLDKFFNN